MQTFRRWMSLKEHRPEEVPDVGQLAILIARSGAAGISRADLARALQVPEETVEELLSAIVTSGQVVHHKANGRLVYRATM